jgi:hypothetical protein
VALEGGGDELVRLHGGPTGAWFWQLHPSPEALWGAMAFEHTRSQPKRTAAAPD